jgi:hypothetical protein
VSVCPEIETVSDNFNNCNITEQLLRDEREIMDVLAETKVKEIHRNSIY